VGVERPEREAFVAEKPAVLEVGGLEVVIPGEECLGEVASPSALFKCELGSPGEQVLDVFFR